MLRLFILATIISRLSAFYVKNSTGLSLSTLHSIKLDNIKLTLFSYFVVFNDNKNYSNFQLSVFNWAQYHLYVFVNKDIKSFFISILFLNDLVIGRLIQNDWATLEAKTTLR